LQNIVIYRDQLLPSSETFIKEQAENLTRYIPYYIGSRSVAGLQLPLERVLTINKQTKIGRVKEVVFKITGYSPFVMNSINKINPVVVHAHFGIDGAIVLPLIKKLNLPFLVTYHGVDATTMDKFIRKSFNVHRLYLNRRDELMQRANIIIAVSDFIKKKLLAQGFPEQKIIQHYTGINVEKFRPDHSIKRKNVVLFVGRLVEVKGCEYVIRAVEFLQKLGTHIELVVIGDGPLRKDLEAKARARLERYQFLGSQPSEIIREWMNSSKVLCVPSVRTNMGNEEAFGMVFAEANAMGVPVVSFRCGGIPEAVADGETGLLATQYDHEELAIHIKRLLEDEALWEKFSIQAQERVHKFFNLKQQTTKLEQIYESALAAHSLQGSSYELLR
jgi:colanic acid/amylovoran biosynthesis glycosyltransferase